jgi:hypothetical protein
MDTPLSIPAIGQAWPGQGGTYGGVGRGRDGKPDCHLILADAEPPTDLSWSAGIEWCKALVVDGHNDFVMFDRFDSHVLCSNVGELFEPDWHWTSTQYSKGTAFVQDFTSGLQGRIGKKAELRVRAVRRLRINPSVLSAGVAQAESVAA